MIETAFSAIARGDWSLLDLIYGDNLSAFASLIRSVFIATPGSKLYVADFSAVETTVLFWIANDVDALDVLRSGRDIYIREASGAYEKPYESITSDERQFGKKLILGLGYGMGFEKFYEQCLDAGLTLDPEFVRRSVSNYRETHSEVVALWFAVESAFRSVLATGRSVALSEGRLVFRREGRDVTVELPSGRRLVYWSPRIVPEIKKIRRRRTVVDPKTGKEKTVSSLVEREVETIYVRGVVKSASGWEYISTYGSKLVENIIQATCRDLMSESMLRVESLGYSILWTAHDEIISEREDGDLREYIREMSALPPWGICDDESRGYGSIPLKSSGWSERRYRK